jgi:hypothetical protein
MLDITKDFLNYGALGAFAAFVLWALVKSCRTIYKDFMSTGYPEKNIPKGLIVRLVDSIQHHLERTEAFLNRTAGVLIRVGEEQDIQKDLCTTHINSLETVTDLLKEQRGNTGKIADSLERLVDIHADPVGSSNNERTNHKLCTIQKGMVEYCIMCKKLAAKSSDPSILEIAVEHCDAIIKAVMSEKEM